MNETEFRSKAKASGYSEPGDQTWTANLEKDMHVHDEDIYLMIQHGMLALRYENDVVEYRPGDVCELPAGTMHAEVTSDEGARGILARRVVSG